MRTESNWEEFEDTAAEIFNVWMDGTELEWAKAVWVKLAEAGLTDYETELERTEVCIRLMTLGAIYHDFCHIAWEEGDIPSFCDWAESFAIQASQVGRLLEAACPAGFVESEAGCDEIEFLEQAYLVLTDAERLNIHRALSPVPETDAPKVYLALHCTRRVSEEEDGDAWDVTGTNSAALCFVAEGFQRQRDYS